MRQPLRAGGISWLRAAQICQSFATSKKRNWRRVRLGPLEERRWRGLQFSGRFLPWLGAAVVPLSLACNYSLIPTRRVDHHGPPHHRPLAGNERLFLCENARPRIAHILPHMEDLGRRVSDPDDDLKYFKWKRRLGMFMCGQNFNFKLFL